MDGKAVKSLLRSSNLSFIRWIFSSFHFGHMENAQNHPIRYGGNRTYASILNLSVDFFYLFEFCVRVVLLCAFIIYLNYCDVSIYTSQTVVNVNFLWFPIVSESAPIYFSLSFASYLSVFANIATSSSSLSVYSLCNIKKKRASLFEVLLKIFAVDILK